MTKYLTMNNLDPVNNTEYPQSTVITVDSLIVVTTVDAISLTGFRLQYTCIGTRTWYVCSTHRRMLRASSELN